MSLGQLEPHTEIRDSLSYSESLGTLLNPNPRLHFSSIVIAILFELFLQTDHMLEEMLKYFIPMLIFHKRSCTNSERSPDHTG